MLAFLLIVGVSYYLVATSLIGLVGDSLFSDRMRQDHAAADQLAAELGPLYAARDMETAQQLMETAGGELGGRLMLLDQSGKVQLDTFCELNGSRLELPEVVSVLAMGSASDYGVHRLDEAGGENNWLRWLRPYDPNAEWVAYCTSALTADGVDGLVYQPQPIAVSEWAGQHKIADQNLLLFDHYQRRLEQERCCSIVEKLKGSQKISEEEQRLAEDFFFQMMEYRAQGTLSRYADALRQHPGCEIMIRLGEGTIYSRWIPSVLNDAVPYTTGFVLRDGQIALPGEDGM